MKNAKIPLTGAILTNQAGGFNMADNTGINIKDTLSAAIERWLYKYKKRSVKVSTFSRLVASLTLFQRYFLSEVRIMDLCTVDVQKYINTLTDEGYSLSTIKKQYNLITGFIRFALGEGIAIRPAYLNVTLPRPENIQKEAKQVIAYEPDDQVKLRSSAAKIASTGAKAAIFMIETGLRVGEILALQWSDIIWQRRAVCIHSTMVNMQGRKKCFVQNSAKSKSSKRTIPLSAIAISLLSSIKNEDKGLGKGLIFKADNLEPIGYNTLRNQIRAVCDDAGVEYYGTHAFRHTFATNAFYKGCDIKILSKLLGHSSVTITYNTYIHLYGDALEEMRSIVD